MSCFYQATVLVKWKHFLSSFTICKRNYNQQTYTSLIWDKKYLKDIENFLGLSGFDPVNSNTHIIKDKAEQKHLHSHTPNAPKKDEK